jgi:hypothetical protein
VLAEDEHGRHEPPVVTTGLWRAGSAVMEELNRTITLSGELHGGRTGGPSQFRPQ